jgi:hypothetical protein
LRGSESESEDVAASSDASEGGEGFAFRRLFAGLDEDADVFDFEDAPAVVGLVIFFVVDLEVLLDGLDAPVVDEARLGGLKGRCRRFCAGCRSGGISDCYHCVSRRLKFFKVPSIEW